MAISDVYVARSGSYTIVNTSATPFLSVFGTAAKRGWVVGVRVEIGASSAAAGNTLLFQLARPGNSAAYSTGNASGNAHDYSSPNSICQVLTGWGTTPTLGTVLWEQELPQTTGSAWEEFPPLGYEWGIPAIAEGSANTGVHLFVTAGVTSSTIVFADIVWSE